MSLTKQEKDELQNLLSDDGTSEDTIWEWCLAHGGYIEVIAKLLDDA